MNHPVVSENQFSGKTYFHTIASRGAVTAEGRLKAKLSRECSDGNLVKINLKKKTFVRGKKSMTGAKVGAVLIR